MNRPQDLVLGQATSEANAPGLERLAVEELGHQKERAVLGHIVVQDMNGAGMSDRIRDVAFPQEALPDLRVERQLAMKHLDRGARAVAVRGGVDRRHPTHAKQPIETPLVPQRRAEASAGQIERRIGYLRSCFGRRRHRLRFDIPTISHETPFVFVYYQGARARPGE